MANHHSSKMQPFSVFLSLSVSLSLDLTLVFPLFFLSFFFFLLFFPLTQFASYQLSIPNHQSPLLFPSYLPALTKFDCPCLDLISCSHFTTIINPRFRCSPSFFPLLQSSTLRPSLFLFVDLRSHIHSCSLIDDFFILFDAILTTVAFFSFFDSFNHNSQHKFDNHTAIISRKNLQPLTTKFEIQSSKSFCSLLYIKNTQTRRTNPRRWTPILWYKPDPHHRVTE